MLGLRAFFVASFAEEWLGGSLSGTTTNQTTTHASASIVHSQNTPYSPLTVTLAAVVAVAVAVLAVVAVVAVVLVVAAVVVAAVVAMVVAVVVQHLVCPPTSYQ